MSTLATSGNNVSLIHLEYFESYLLVPNFVNQLFLVSRYDTAIKKAFLKKFGAISVVLIRGFCAVQLAVDKRRYSRKVSPFFSFFTRLCSFHCPPFSIFCPFTWFESGVKVSLNQGEIRTIGVKFLSTMFINPDIYKTI